MFGSIQSSICSTPIHTCTRRIDCDKTEPMVARMDPWVNPLVGWIVFMCAGGVGWFGSCHQFFGWGWVLRIYSDRFGVGWVRGGFPLSGLLPTPRVH